MSFNESPGIKETHSIILGQFVAWDRYGHWRWLTHRVDKPTFPYAFITYLGIKSTYFDVIFPLGQPNTPWLWLVWRLRISLFPRDIRISFLGSTHNGNAEETHYFVLVTALVTIPSTVGSGLATPTLSYFVSYVAYPRSWLQRCRRKLSHMPQLPRFDTRSRYIYIASYFVYSGPRPLKREINVVLLDHHGYRHPFG